MHTEVDCARKEDFSKVVNDSRCWNDLPDMERDLFDSPPGKNPRFLWGTGTCTYQDSGFFHCPYSQWAEWEKRCLNEDNRSGKSANLFEHYQSNPNEVIGRLLALGVNSYRFSVEWSQIEPEKGQFCEDKLLIYLNFCKLLRNQRIEPMVTLHHFSEPQWFHDLGSFENENNICHFVAFCERIYSELTQEYKGSPLVGYFCTINEPGIESFNRFIMGSFSPGKTQDFQRAALFLKGALKAHCQTYRALKKINGKAQIGIVHQYLRFIPLEASFAPAANLLSHVVNETQLNFFKTGTFLMQITPDYKIIEEGDGTLPPTDFVGLQYYARPVIGNNASTSFHEPMTTMPFREDPEGIYEAITVSYDAYRKPIIVTENGISTHDDAQRDRYLSRALYATKRAEDVIGSDNLMGYYLWSFVDNLEWNMGMRPQAFGAYRLDEGKISTNPKPGVALFVQLATRHKSLKNNQ